MTGTNVFCDHCGEEVTHDDSFVVTEATDVVRAYHFKCGSAIYNAMLTTMLSD